MRRIVSLAALALATRACAPAPDGAPVVVDVIDTRGEKPVQYERVRRGALAQGLVRLDASGQVEPGLAARWNVIDEGRSYIFRLGDATWADGRPVTADQVVRGLRRAMASRNGNPLASSLVAVREVVAMTPQVIEIRLSSPRPAFLTLLAQPELGIVRNAAGMGSGPFRTGTDATWLRPATVSDDVDPSADGADSIRLRGNTPALAIARFGHGMTDMVLGGGVADWPLLQAGGIAVDSIRVDPAAGLFGFAIVSREGMLATPLGRAAIAMALTDAAVPAAVDADWEAATTVLPERLESAAEPALPPWRNLTVEQRHVAARAQVAMSETPVSLRVALPAGPGGTRLWGRVAAGLQRIGVDARRVSLDADADLVLVDVVAPHDNARWYLMTACRACSPQVRQQIDAARDASTMAERARLLAAADADLAADVAFVPLARPLRWSLVRGRLDGFRINARAWHPLNRVHADPK